MYLGSSTIFGSFVFVRHIGEQKVILHYVTAWPGSRKTEQVLVTLGSLTMSATPTGLFLFVTEAYVMVKVMLRTKPTLQGFLI